MSYSLDANVLLYASDSGGRWHEPAQAFLERCAASYERLVLGWPTLMAYLRIATHPKIFDDPLTPEQAEHNVQQLLEWPQVEMLAEGRDFWWRYRELSGAVTLRGNFVPDAHLAALLREHGVRKLYTKDRDFQRFPFLDARDPFPEKAAAP